MVLTPRNAPIRITVSGDKRLARKFRRLSSEQKPKTKQAIRVSTLAVLKTTTSLTRMPARGVIYTTTFWTDAAGNLRVGRPKPPHQASAPGDPFHSETGKTIATLEAEFQNNGLTGIVGTNDLVFFWQEFGTRKSRRHRGIKPRPTLRPGFAKNKENIVKAIRAAMRQDVRDVARGR